MSDSSRIFGIPDFEYLEFDLGYAQINIPLDKIRRVTSASVSTSIVVDDPFEATVKKAPLPDGQFIVEMANRDRFTGRVLNQSCRVRFIAGELTLPFAEMKAFASAGTQLNFKRSNMNGLIAHYAFAKNTAKLTKNQAANKLHCSLGSTALVKGGKGTAPSDKFARFQGTTRIHTPHTGDLCPAKITLSAWIKPKAGHRHGYAFIAGKTEQSSWEGGYAFIYMHNDPTNIYFYVNGYQKQVVNITVADGKWTHLTGTYDGKFVKLYKNGVEVQRAPGNNAPIAHTSSPFTIGGDPSAYYWHGDIDEVMIFNDALTKADAKLLYTNSKR